MMVVRLFALRKGQFKRLTKRNYAPNMKDTKNMLSKTKKFMASFALMSKVIICNVGLRRNKFMVW